MAITPPRLTAASQRNPRLLSFERYPEDTVELLPALELVVGELTGLGLLSELPTEVALLSELLTEVSLLPE